MSRNTTARRARLELEHLEDRCSPSALLGHHPAQVPAPLQEPPELAAAGANGDQHAVPVRLTTHITADGSGGLSFTGKGSHLGHWTGQGNIDSVDIDPATDQGAATGTVTITTANGDQLFASFSASWQLSTGVGEVNIIFTGGTGRFTGVTGSASEVCHVTADPASPLTFECDSQGSGTLVFARAH